MYLFNKFSDVDDAGGDDAGGGDDDDIDDDDNCDGDNDSLGYMAHPGFFCLFIFLETEGVSTNFKKSPSICVLC